ncbi:hypothetical protein [Mycobacterium parmense]|uniref:Uncharacterized protein n=1 Tax=Mycobacterium parmense TaxID=185642 RepID=A0A7I7YYC8_9MYCO|nr:hypothetical protein [Mycobacterium parmense]MCV7352893.1 hypothetical protein [Mycobacterium parmense]BBZ46905.1 hypothetical protein MPRM_41860 [Mycobacterium parmense]
MIRTSRRRPLVALALAAAVWAAPGPPAARADPPPPPPGPDVGVDDPPADQMCWTFQRIWVPCDLLRPDPPPPGP